MRQAMHRSPAALAEGLDAWLVRHSDGLEAEAAALTVAELLTIAGDYLTDKKWSG